VASKIGEALNRATSQGAGGAGGQAGSSGDGSGSSGEDVVDAEFEEVDPRNQKAS
jgi:molecular chaperone DnaK